MHIFHWYLIQILTCSQDGSVDPIQLWKVLPKNNPLVKLAVLLLSFVPNSASTKQLFSKMGNIKTKKIKSNGDQKLWDLTFIKSEL
jgi:hypothetical protein